ncbi:MAG: Ryanodine receptor Ryr [Lachnospiraceae bacterium]|nr:Ryanodine receptor Ryr [Lachnospiraceae bacterium]
MKKEYVPEPIDTSDVQIPEELLELTEVLAKNTHHVWAAERKKQGWVYGLERNDALKTTPCMTFYEELTEEEREYDRNTAMQTIKLLLKLGYRIEK